MLAASTWSSSNLSSSARPLRPFEKYAAALLETSLPCRSRLWLNQKLTNFWISGRSMPPALRTSPEKPDSLQQLAGALENAAHAALADEHVVRFFGEHEPRRARQRIERAFRQRQQLRLAVAVGEHREGEEVEPGVDRLVEGLEHARRVVVAAAAFEQRLGLLAAVAPEVRVQHVDHGPEMAAFLDVDLEQVAQVVEARAMGAERALLFDAGGLGVALDHDQAAQLVAEFAGHFLPHRLALEVAEADAAIVRRLGQENAPAIFRQLDVIEVRPAGGVDADRRAQVDLVAVLEPGRPHVAPPIEIGGLPVLERAQQPLVAGEIDVVRNFFSRDHCVTPWRSTVPSGLSIRSS